MNLYVGNLAPKTTEFQIRKAFEKYGKVDTISFNTQDGKDKAYGFCFVKMPFDIQASFAIKGLNGKELVGNILTISESAV